jgi:hypothetical protein
MHPLVSNHFVQRQGEADMVLHTLDKDQTAIIM